MSTQPPFVLDANIFIEAATRYYAFDIAPTFWDSLAEHGRAGRILTIDRIAKEVTGDSDLRDWMDGAFASCIYDSANDETIAYYTQLMEWSQSQPFTDAAKSEFATVGDAWLIAYVKATSAILVTHEKFDPTIRRKVKIPNACRWLNVPCVDAFTMVRSLKIKLGG